MIVSLLIDLDATELHNVPAGTGPSTTLRCSGTEPRVMDCILFNPYYYRPCDHSNDVGLRCLTRGPSTGVCVSLHVW